MIRCFSNPPALKNSNLVAFGMTKRAGRSAANDPVIAPLMAAKALNVCFVGKSWDFHVTDALGVSLEDNLEMIGGTVAYAATQKQDVMYDAEHFFDGYKANPDYALACLKAAYDNGARWVVLCDTNGGTLPHEVEKKLSPTFFGIFRATNWACTSIMIPTMRWPTAWRQYASAHGKFKGPSMDWGSDVVTRPLPV